MPSTNHFKLDVGYLQAPRSGFQGLETAVNLYAIPINRATDLRDSGLSGWEQVGARVGLTLGLVSVRLDRSEEVTVRSGIGAPLVGLAIRSPLYGYCIATVCLDRGRGWLQPLRLGIGAVILEQANANPIIDQRKTVWDLYWSVTYDIEVKSLLLPFTALLGK